VIPALDPDPAVPQRDLLLDPQLVAARLGLALGAAIEDCLQTRVKYRVGARLRVVHRVRARGATFDVAASTFPTLERGERALAQASERAVTCGPVPPVALDRELTTVFWTFPNDRKLEHLAALTQPAPELAQLLPEWSRSTLVAYAPEKNATVRCLDAAGRTLAFAKTYSGDEGERTAHVHDELLQELGTDDDHLRVPQALAYSSERQTLIVETVEGRPLRTPGSYRRLGRALARLHGLSPPDAMRFRRVEPDKLAAAAGLIGLVREDVAGSARELADELCSRLDRRAEAVCLHGDVNFRNALLENGRVVLIDLDQAAAGPAAAELGSVLASLRYARIVGLIRSELVPELCEALLAGYAELRRPPKDDQLRAHTAAALLAERCLRVVTRVRPEGLRRLPVLLAEAREVLA
jgi:Ser/Thr protein kinase RdoA (MazF antagonist)